MRKEATEKDLATFEYMLDQVQDGQAILTAGEIHPDIPTINRIGYREGAGLKSDDEVAHLGFGLFRGHVKGLAFFFDGGGAMRRSDGFSWCFLKAEKAEDRATVLEALGYDLEKVVAALESLRSEAAIALAGQGVVEKQIAEAEASEV